MSEAACKKGYIKQCTGTGNGGRTERADFSECPLSSRTAKEALRARQPSSLHTPSHFSVWLVLPRGNCGGKKQWERISSTTAGVCTRHQNMSSLEEGLHKKRERDVRYLPPELWRWFWVTTGLTEGTDFTLEPEGKEKLGVASVFSLCRSKPLPVWIKAQLKNERCFFFKWEKREKRVVNSSK